MIGPASTSDEKSSSAQIASISGFLHGFELNPPAVGLATLKIYDSENSTVSGKQILCTATVAAGQNSIYVELPSPRVANKGLYATLTGTTTYVVGFSLG